MKQLVLKNQFIPGSVNTGTRHFAMAVDDLESAYNKWDGLVDEIITTRIPYTRSWKRLTDDQLTISSRLWSDAGRAEHFGPVGYFRPSLKARNGRQMPMTAFFYMVRILGTLSVKTGRYAWMDYE